MKNNPKDVYDISQTTATKPQDNIYTIKEVLQAFLGICKSEMKAVDRLSNGEIGVEYLNDTLYLCRGMEQTRLLQSVAQQLAKIEFQKEDTSEMKSFKTYFS